MTDGKATALHAASSKLLPKGGFKAMRRGGSSGATAIKEEHFQFLDHEASFPRKANQIKIIQQELGWDTVCMKPWHPRQKAISFNRCCQPQRGGSFHLPPKLMKKFPVLCEFMKLKIHTAQIMAVLNTEHGCALQSLAAKTMRDDLSEAQEMSGDVFEILCLVFSMDTHSMVCYPVGCHVDTFAKNKASLENKICFVVKNWHGGMWAWGCWPKQARVGAA